ncbi:methylase involved in ubiquinone/menaquinone biosynthesis [Saccharomonospora marina XMU15]|uniref:Methylase involved in ubiquinone/menaquinone biosynthesis n=1 Tax=Saccharomonospora marina XMU15 TaxID=882083 RepID=H5X7T3_9PSEU|nr:class I SAM-dependent methyltransferase [Saccharomonospora marina]EHR52433.1 methylase involved in ubiquinone/menaquinone biosynthesis [Saccharomonospora marina XMU15]
MHWAASSLVAEVYDRGHPPGFSYGDIEYYTRALRDVTGPVLDVACGTGRILVPLLEAGIAADGLDLSPEMLAICERHCRARGLRPRLHRGDMAGFRLDERYEAVIIPAGSIKGLTGRAAVLRALRAMGGVLRPGGRLVADVAPPRLVVGSKPLRSWADGEHLWTVQTVHAEYDAAANHVTEYLRYEKWHRGRATATELHTFGVQFWSVREFHGLLTEAGFSDITVVGDYHEDREPGTHDDDWTFHAVWPGSQPERIGD